MLEPVACVPDSSHHFCWLALGMSSYLPLLRSLICEMGTVLAPSQALRALGTQADGPGGVTRAPAGPACALPHPSSTAVGSLAPGDIGGDGFRGPSCPSLPGQAWPCCSPSATPQTQHGVVSVTCRVSSEGWLSSAACLGPGVMEQLLTSCHGRGRSIP